MRNPDNIIINGRTLTDIIASQTINKRANLWGADLREADLWGANLWGADLWEADLWGANLWGADLREADLWGANLWRADLREADLREANLWGADLWEADLRGANLWEADLRGANLWGANLWGANGIYVFGDIGENNRFGYAWIEKKEVIFGLGCRFGNLKDTIKAIQKKYGRNSTYEAQIKLASQILLEKYKDTK